MKTASDIAPGPSPREFPYDSEGFKQWCVNIQGKSLGTANSYLSAIRTAYTSYFRTDIDNPFEDLKIAFLYVRNVGDIGFPVLELAFQALQEDKEMIEEEMEERGFVSIVNAGECKDAPVDIWLAAMRAYIRYVRSKIDRLRQMNGLPLTISDDKERFLELPMTKEFRQYLKTLGKGYTPASIDSICCRLRRLYNLFLRRRLKVDVMPDLEKYIDEGHSLKPFLQLVESKIDYENEGQLAPELTAEDFSRGKAAFTLYREFVEDYSRHPEKYSPERYAPKEKNDKTINR